MRWTGRNQNEADFSLHCRKCVSESRIFTGTAKGCYVFSTFSYAKRPWPSHYFDSCRLTQELQGSHHDQSSSGCTQ